MFPPFNVNLLLAVYLADVPFLMAAHILSSDSNMANGLVTINQKLPHETLASNSSEFKVKANLEFAPMAKVKGLFFSSLVRLSLIAH